MKKVQIKYVLADTMTSTIYNGLNRREVEILCRMRGI